MNYFLHLKWAVAMMGYLIEAWLRERERNVRRMGGKQVEY